MIKRNLVPKTDQWNLSKLFASQNDFIDSLEKFPLYSKELKTYTGLLKTNYTNFIKVLKLSNSAEIELERIHYYAMLRLQEDLTNSESNSSYARVCALVAEFNEAVSFLNVELQDLSDETLQTYLQNDEAKDFSIAIAKIRRYKEHTLSTKEEALLAPLSNIFNLADDTFSALTDADMQFKSVKTPDGEKPLSQASFSQFLKNPDQNIRRTAYHNFYGEYDKHKNTLASLYGGSVKQDIYSASIKGFASAREKALFADDAPTAVYDNLIKTIRENLSILHRYYRLRKKILKLDTLHHYDLHAPLFNSTSDRKISYNDGVDIIANSCSVLGDDYVSTMKNGLLNGWVDRYENIGKSSGAFSAGSYKGDPYILMNYKENDIRSLFTLAHEAGHSMHSYYSVANNPFANYNYTIFEAEVASTFNEALLHNYLLANEKDEARKISLISSRIDDILSTLFRQTMFAEYELNIHRAIEEGTPPSLDFFRNSYQELLDAYFGGEVVFEEFSNLEGLRIPHFYRAFYVYKYSTGISASLALSKQVLENPTKHKDDYLGFLKNGGRYFPIDNLKLAGVDMKQSAVVKSAISVFENLLNQLESYSS